MRVTVTSEKDDFFTLEVAEDMELENFKALCESECSISATQMVVIFEGKPLLEDKKDLKTCGIREGDVVLVRSKAPRMDSSSGSGLQGMPDFSGIQVPSAGASASTSRGREAGQDDPAYIRSMLLQNPDQMGLLKHNNPRLAEAVEKGLDEFTKVLRQQQHDRAEQERLRIRMLVADPFDSQAQTMIAEEIKKQNIESNMETAMEFHPEAYGQVTMLYIDCKVNGHLVKAFVDSGAQSTIMSKACAERCNITRLIDTRWSGIAKGVGTQKIIGRIHLCQVQIEKDFLASSFTILGEQPMDMLLGLDMLKRHQCSIDLRKNVLLIGTTGTETRFLSESEIPEFAKSKGFLMEGEEGEAMDEHEFAEALRRSVSDAQPATNSSLASSVSAHPHNVVKELMDLGFAREQVIQELNRTNGNKAEAMAALLAKALMMPPNK